MLAQSVHPFGMLKQPPTPASSGLPHWMFQRLFLKVAVIQRYMAGSDIPAQNIVLDWIQTEAIGVTRWRGCSSRSVHFYPGQVIYTPFNPRLPHQLVICMANLTQT